MIATVGPAGMSARALISLLRAGADVARLSLSHGTRAFHARMISGTAARRPGSGGASPSSPTCRGPRPGWGASPEEFRCGRAPGRP
ncbi:MAG: hypothetical protein ACE5JH_07450 [Acidobacteriota bacterium]